LQFLEIVLGAAKNLAARIGQVRRMRIAKAIDAHPLSPSKALAAASPIMHRCVPPSHALTAWAYDTAPNKVRCACTFDEEIMPTSCGV
jgi:hypothetical protein